MSNTRVIEPGVNVDDAIDIRTAEDGAPVPATVKPKCICCDPPANLSLGKEDVPYALCKSTNTVYKQEENGTYARTDFYIDEEDNCIRDAQGNQVFPKPKEASSTPCANDLLDACRITDNEETAGGSKPDAGQRDRVNLRESDHH